MKNKLTLQKSERLKSRKQIEHLFSKGKSLSVFPYRVIYYAGTTDHKQQGLLKAGFAVSSKFFKRAVDRNRIKRITREAYRIQKSSLEEKLIRQKKSLDIFLLYTGKELPDFTLAKEKLGLILQKLIQQVDEKGAPDT